MLEKLVRKNVLELHPYSSARDEFMSVAEIYLDANENPNNWEYNRYPDPYQQKLKAAIGEWRKIETKNIFIGNGSDEIIDLIIRAFCEPGIDSIVTLNPSYGMYKVSADINNINFRYFPLDENFNFSPIQLLDFIKPNDKIIFICSPNNPSGNIFDKVNIVTICKKFNGLVIVDEAYIDFAEEAGMLSEIGELDNLIVVQTLSKAMGAAGIRLGMAFMNDYIVKILNKIKPPYNVNTATQKIALELVKNKASKLDQVQSILIERQKLDSELKKLTFVIKVFPSQANFILARVTKADHLYNYLLGMGIVVRNRNKQFRCEECIRFTIGTEIEIERLINALHHYQD
ncbi:MAG: histidinol-phosphate transaminase [Saprospiraceae bacterium]|jgi:histidinol-phosphate aminotransferase|nr:histidinol-phosphate transaminase [Saprospiraceae bacterium]